jgi:hypothetical protein
MKTKIFLVLIILTSIIYEASAHITIVISGGSNKHLFNVVKVSSREIRCEGAGTNSCPVDFGAAQMSGVYHPLKDVTEFVFSEIAKGNNNGTTQYKNDLPVTWKVLTDNSVQIEVEEKDLIGLEKYGMN